MKPHIFTFWFIVIVTTLLRQDIFYPLQTSAKRTKPGPSFQLNKWPFACCTILVFSVKLPNLMLKTLPGQILGSLLLVIALPVLTLFLNRKCISTFSVLPYLGLLL
jgi:hypothetical protein